MQPPHPQPRHPLRLVRLAGSERPATSGALRPSAHSAPLGPVEATLVLRRRAQLPPAALSGPGLSPEEFAAAYGADPADVRSVAERFSALGLEIVQIDAASRRLRVRGDVATMERVFGTSLEAGPETAASDGVATYRVRSGGLSIPADLDGIVTAVLGLDDRPQGRSRSRIASARAVSVSYTPVELAKIYDFPTAVDGSGQTIAIIELGGGFAQSDLDSYFAGLGLPTPSVSAVGVDGAANVAGGDPSGADGEVLLDIEVAGAMAPGAHLVVYFAPNTDAGFLDAVSQAAHATPTPVAVSISWGQSEDDWTAQARQAMDDAFVDAAALGATVTCAAGDDGSTDRAQDSAAHVDFPAASPHALACGGTRLDADPATGAVRTETVWNNGVGNGATGGGYSVTFPRPDYQQSLPTLPSPLPSPLQSPRPSQRAAAAASSAAVSVETGGKPATIAPGTGRGVPDVAAVADPQTGYQVLVDGRRQVIGGTSAVAPLWAALIARLAQAAGHRFGLIQPLLYAAEPTQAAGMGRAAETAGQVQVEGRAGAATVVTPNATEVTAAPSTGGAFRDITQGNNGAYAAGPGWDACTGLGVPIGSKLAHILSAATT